MVRTVAAATPAATRRLKHIWDRRALALAAAYLAAYVLFEAVSYVRPLLKPAITPWNPQAGLTLALLIYFGWRWWPLAALAALLAQVLVKHIPVPLPLIIASSLWIGIAYGFIAAVLRYRELAAPIRTAMSAARLATIAIIGTLVVAAGYVGLFAVFGELRSTDALAGMARYWVGDLNGILPLTPLLIYATDWRERLRTIQRHRWEIFAQFAAVALMLWIIFLLPATDQLRFFYLLFVPIIWIALRWRWPGAMLAVLAIQVGLLVVAEARIPTARFIDLQFLMLTLTLTGLLLGAVVAEREGVLERVAMREAEQRALLAMAPDAVLAVDASERIHMANAAAVRLFGESARVGEHAVRLTKLLPNLNLDAPEGRATIEGLRHDGSGFAAEIAWAGIDPPANRGVLIIVRDATDRRRAAEQLRARDAALARAMRFAVAGELASALAHELNQPITALVSYLRASEILATGLVGADDRLEATLGKAVQEGIRASEVLRRLRDFYQSGALKKEKIQFSSLCAAAVSAFQERLRRAEASLTASIDPSIPTLEGDSTQLEIVLHNLLANALDAVSESPQPRRIQITAGHLNGTVRLTVEDSGPGIPAEMSGKLFEPFVTSKPDGMGLGLAISRSLVRARGGELSFEPSKVLGGAAFTILVPVEVPEDAPLV